jgi:hypothetical protein
MALSGQDLVYDEKTRTVCTRQEQRDGDAKLAQYELQKAAREVAVREAKANAGVVEIKPSLFAGKSGATSRSVALDYGLCPKELQEAGISRFEHGVKKGHARNNWRTGLDDAGFQYNRLMHAQKHLAKVVDGTGDWGDVQAVICNLAMLCWWRVNGKGFAEAFPWLLK